MRAKSAPMGDRGMQEKLLYRIPEAAQFLSLSESKVRNLIRAGDIHSVLIGRARRIPSTAIVTYLHKLSERPGGDD